MAWSPPGGSSNNDPPMRPRSAVPSSSPEFSPPLLSLPDSPPASLTPRVRLDFETSESDIDRKVAQTLQLAQMQLSSPLSVHSRTVPTCPESTASESGSVHWPGRTRDPPVVESIAPLRRVAERRPPVPSGRHSFRSPAPTGRLRSSSHDNSAFKLMDTSQEEAGGACGCRVCTHPHHQHPEAHHRQPQGRRRGKLEGSRVACYRDHHPSTGKPGQPYINPRSQKLNREASALFRWEMERQNRLARMKEQREESEMRAVHAHPHIDSNSQRLAGSTCGSSQSTGRRKAVEQRLLQQGREWQQRRQAATEQRAREEARSVGKPGREVKVSSRRSRSCPPTLASPPRRSQSGSAASSGRGGEDVYQRLFRDHLAALERQEESDRRDTFCRERRLNPVTGERLHQPHISRRSHQLGANPGLAGKPVHERLISRGVEDLQKRENLQEKAAAEEERRREVHRYISPYSQLLAELRQKRSHYCSQQGPSATERGREPRKGPLEQPDHNRGHVSPSDLTGQSGACLACLNPGLMDENATFHPEISEVSKEIVSRRGPTETQRDLHKRGVAWKRGVEERCYQKAEALAREEMSGCTFTPDPTRARYGASSPAFSGSGVGEGAGHPGTRLASSRREPSRGGRSRSRSRSQTRTKPTQKVQGMGANPRGTPRSERGEDSEAGDIYSSGAETNAALKVEDPVEAPASPPKPLPQTCAPEPEPDRWGMSVLESTPDIPLPTLLERAPLLPRGNTLTSPEARTAGGQCPVGPAPTSTLAWPQTSGTQSAVTMNAQQGGPRSRGGLAGGTPQRHSLQQNPIAPPGITFPQGCEDPGSDEEPETSLGECFTYRCNVPRDLALQGQMA